MRLILILLVVVGVVTSGCFRYVPVGETRPQPGQEVRIVVSEPLEVELNRVTLREAKLFDGPLVRWNQDSLVVSAWWVESQGGLRQVGEGELVGIPVVDVALVETRELATGKSVLVGSAIVAGVLVALDQFFGESIFGSVGGSGDGPPTQGLVVPWR